MPAKGIFGAGIPGRPFRGYLYGTVYEMMPAKCTLGAGIPGRLFRGYLYGPAYGMAPAKRTIRADTCSYPGSYQNHTRIIPKSSAPCHTGLHTSSQMISPEPLFCGFSFREYIILDIIMKPARQI